MGLTARMTSRRPPQCFFRRRRMMRSWTRERASGTGNGSGSCTGTTALRLPVAPQCTGSALAARLGVAVTLWGILRLSHKSLGNASASAIQVEFDSIPVPNGSVIGSATGMPGQWRLHCSPSHCAGTVPLALALASQGSASVCQCRWQPGLTRDLPLALADIGSALALSPGPGLRLSKNSLAT